MDDEHEVVIGREFASAMEAEQRRVARGGQVRSPLPSGRYDPGLGQLGLYSIEPLPLDDALTEFVREYRTLPDEHRTELRDGVSLDDAYTLLAFARRCAVFAIRTQDATLVADGVTACTAIGYERVDPRDTSVAAALLHHAAQCCEADVARSFRESASLGEPAMEQLVAGFLGRPATERDLREAWGYVKTEGPAGLGLLRWGFAPWMPTRDLVEMSLRVAAALRDDEYWIEDPELAVKLPAVWLSAADDPELEPILGAACGAVVIHGRLRPEVTPDHDHQQLTVWLVELGGDVAAERLARLSLTPRPGDALLGLAAGPVFALVVARSAVMGTVSHEDSARLRRLEPATKAALKA